jgi:hypothetical protein
VVNPCGFQKTTRYLTVLNTASLHIVASNPAIELLVLKVALFHTKNKTFNSGKSYSLVLDLFYRPWEKKDKCFSVSKDDI